MNCRIALLSALTISLLISACSKKEDQATDDAQATGDATAQVEAAADEPSAPPPRLTYWPVVGPLVAGNYGGECMRMPDARKMDASVAVGADGKVASSGLDIDFREAGKIMLMRVRDEKGLYRSTAMFAMSPEKAGMLTVQFGQGDLGTVSLGRDDVGITCSGIDGDHKLNAQPLYQSLASLISGKKQTLSCLDTKNLLVRRDLDVEIDGSVLKVGDASYDLKNAELESVTVDDAGESMVLSVSMPDKRAITLMYDGAGTLKALMGMNQQESSHSCERKT